MKIPDLWNNCYDGEHRKAMSPEVFKQTFCDACMNTGCSNSKGAGTQWMKRMLTQEDRLLNNPDFANTNDPRFSGFAEMNFKNMMQEALAIEIADRKGDWEVPTQEEIGQAAAEMLGVLPPTSFQPDPEPEPDPEPDPEPEPPPRLVDEVGQTDIEGKTLEEPEEGPDGEWQIKGDSGNLYLVTLWKDGSWKCGCPSIKECKHIHEIKRKLSQAPPEPVREDPVRPPPPPPGAFVRNPKALNTTQPQGGVMVGGAPLPPEPDPWAAPPKSKERVIDIGGKVTFGKKS